MCGILLIVYQDDDAASAEQWVVKSDEMLRRRGPDANHQLDFSLSSNWNARFCGYTLWLQGDRPRQQPVVDEEGNVLLWNGDVFHDSECQSPACDSDVLMKRLADADTVERVEDVLSRVSGPWSMIYFRKSLNLLVIGRDPLGRHSLLWNVDDSHQWTGPLIVASAVPEGTYSEVPADRMFAINFSRSPTIESLSSRRGYRIDRRIPAAEEGFGRKEEGTSRVLERVRELHKSELDRLEAALTRAVRVRVESQPPVCQTCADADILLQKWPSERSCGHTKLAVLFSGGLDSAVLAALCHGVWPVDEAIDLLNVAFPVAKKDVVSFDVPDRLTGLQALGELRAAFPQRQWNFVQVDVGLEELAELRCRRIASLILPSTTVLDDSIGCAQWFAARGRGQLVQPDGRLRPYTSPARVVLMGAGADEQLGGYARHRQRFADGGWPALVAEMEMEMARLWQRNLGRDNRVIGDHGRAPRLPYLDESVVALLADAPIWLKADLRLAAGVGDKLILRALAHRLGLALTSTQPKRAIQFGSRIAKAESRREKGSQTCQRLVPASATMAS